MSSRSSCVCTEKPKYQEFSDLDKRKESFETWPENCPVSAEQLATAGFWYAGVDDCVRCFYCGEGLREWKAGDDPWIEHARWFPSCGHVHLVKGPKFVLLVQQLKIFLNDISQTENEDSANNTAILALLKIGVSPDDVNKALQLLRSRDGRKNFNPNELYSLVVDIKEVPDSIEEAKAEQDSLFDGSFDDTGIEKLAEENARLRDVQSCKICLESMADIVFLPCGHMVSCGMCAPVVTECPLCQKNISGYVKAVMANSAVLRHRC